MIKQIDITDKIRWIKEELLCDICGSTMQYDDGGRVLMSYPPQYPHTCSNKNCESRTNALSIYPRHFMDVLE